MSNSSRRAQRWSSKRNGRPGYLQQNFFINTVPAQRSRMRRGRGTRNTRNPNFWVPPFPWSRSAQNPSSNFVPALPPATQSPEMSLELGQSNEGFHPSRSSLYGTFPPATNVQPAILYGNPGLNAVGTHAHSQFCPCYSCQTTYFPRSVPPVPIEAPTMSSAFLNPGGISYYPSSSQSVQADSMATPIPNQILGANQLTPGTGLPNNPTESLQHPPAFTQGGATYQQQNDVLPKTYSTQKRLVRLPVGFRPDGSYGVLHPSMPSDMIDGHSTFYANKRLYSDIHFQQGMVHPCESQQPSGSRIVEDMDTGSN